MSDEHEWSVEFYETADGKSPVAEFLSSFDDKTQARFIWSIDQLRLLNVRAREPLVKHLEGKLWELRRASDGDIYRLLYFFFSGRKIVIVHGFQKKSQKTPRKEIELAYKRMNDYITRNRGR